MYPCCHGLDRAHLHSHRAEILQDAGTSWEGLRTRATYLSLSQRQHEVLAHIEHIDSLLASL